MKIELELETLASLLGQTSKELTDELFEGDEEKTQKSDSQKLIKSKYTSRLRDIEKDAKDEGYGKAKREVLTTVEKSIATKFNVEKQSIEEMFESVKSKAEENSKSGAVTLEQIKSSEHYDGLFTPFTDKIAAFETENKTLKGELSQIKKRSSTTKHFSGFFNDYDVKKARHKTSVENELMKYDFDFEKNQVLQDGKVVKDEFRKAIEPETFFHLTASEWLDKKEAQTKQTPGSKSNFQAPPKPSGSGITFEGKEDYMQKVSAEKDIEKREIIKTAWKEQNTKQE